MCVRQRLLVRSHGKRLKGRNGSEMRLVTNSVIRQLFDILWLFLSTFKFCCLKLPIKHIGN